MLLLFFILSSNILSFADGRANRGNLNDAINRIRNTDIQVYVVGIGSISISQLRSIATDPDDDHVFILKNYLDAAGFVDILSATTCESKYKIGNSEFLDQLGVIHLIYEFLGQQRRYTYSTT